MQECSTCFKATEVGHYVLVNDDLNKHLMVKFQSVSPRLPPSNRGQVQVQGRESSYVRCTLDPNMLPSTVIRLAAKFNNG